MPTRGNALIAIHRLPRSYWSFEQARKSGDLPKASDPAALARYLMVMANGLCVQASAGASAKELKEVAAIALTNWPMMVAAGSKKSRVKEPA